MLAVKLHRKETPWLGNGSFLVPIFNWEVGSIQVRRWIKVLNNHNRGRPNHHIRYMTQVRIPDDLPISLHSHWIEKKIFPSVFKPLREIDPELKQFIIDWEDANPPEDLEDLTPSSLGGPKCPFPEIILGASLPEKHILWTKDLFLLYRD